MRDNFPQIPETFYGVKKRVNFIYGFIQSLNKRDLSVLDVGCGTGALLTIPLASKGLKMSGIDFDENSIVQATRNAKRLKLPANFKVGSIDDVTDEYDVVILSEVLEHIKQPDKFLAKLVKRVKSGGHLILTIPNGYGPFEVDQYLWKRNFLYLPKIYLSRVSARNVRQKAVTVKRDTLNESNPHVNWFTWRAINRLFAGNNLELIKYSPRAFLSGSYLDLLCATVLSTRIKLDWLATVNCQIANVLPPQASSGWMFVCRKSQPGRNHS